MESFVGLQRLVRSADPLVQHDAAGRRAKPIGGAVHDQRGHGDLAHVIRERVDCRRQLGHRASGELSVVDERVLDVGLHHLGIATDQ